MMDNINDTQTTPQEVPRLPRLNPFAFPSNTTLRFFVLIISVISSSLFIYTAMSSPVLIDQLNAYIQCPTTNATGNASRACSAPFLLLHVLFLTGGIALVLGTATVIYWLIPLWKLRWEKLVPLSSEDAPEVVEYLSKLCNETELTPVPRFVWNPLNFTSGAVAFGHFGRYYISLTGGLVTMFYTDQAAFRAIMLHELAHLRNRDVNKTYFTVSIWWAFVAAALVPFVIEETFIALSRSDLFGLYQIWRIIALTVLVYLTRNGVLRAREFYADVRASIWENSSEALTRVLQSLPPSHGRWQTLARVHPDPHERSQILQETHRLFRLNLWTIFSLGIAIGVAFPNIEDLLNDLFSLLIPTNVHNPFWLGYIWYGELAALGTGLIFASLLVGTIGVDIWRERFAALVQRRSQSDIDRVSLGLGGGLIIGTLLSLSVETPIARFDIRELFVLNLAWGLLLLISLMLFLRWIATGASVWLEITTKRSSPRLIYRTGLAIAGIVLTAWLAQLFLFRAISLTVFSEDFLTIRGSSADALIHTLGLPDPRFAPILVFLGSIWRLGPLLALISLWAFPLSVWFWHKQATTTAQPSWAFLDTPSPSLNSLYQDSIRPRFTLMTGLVGGLVFCGLYAILRIWLELNVSLATRGTDQFLLNLYWGTIALAALLQAVVAGIVAARVKLLGGLHGLFAAFVAGCVMTIGFLAINLLRGGSINGPFIWTTFSTMINGGALLALPVVLIVSAIARSLSKEFRDWQERNFATPAVTIPDPKQRTQTRIRLATSIVLVVLLLIPTAAFTVPLFLPSTVTNLNDNGPGSLRQAINDAQPESTITFAQGLRGTILLTKQLELTKNITITGPGANILAISFGDRTGINPAKNLLINLGVTVTISGITFQDTKASLPIIVNQGTVTLKDCIIKNNMTVSSQDAAGGAIANLRGTLTLIRSTLSDNMVEGSVVLGGGMYNSKGTVVLLQSSISGNKVIASQSGGGGGIGSFGGKITLSDSHISNNAVTVNQEDGLGGGILQYPDTTTQPGKMLQGSLTLNDSTVSGNTITVTSNLNTSNHASPAPTQAAGGGIASVSSTLSITNSIISGNTSTAATGYGGGISSAGNGSITLTNSTISGNTTTSRGTANSYGGGLEVESGSTFQLTNSTISGNTATGGQGGIGGGIQFDGAQGTMSFCTIYNNTATSSGGGIGTNDTGQVSSNIVMKETILANNTAKIAPDMSGTLTSNGYNLIQSFSGITFLDPQNKHSTDLSGDTLPNLGIDPQLKNNGGPTQTHALLPGSPTIDRIPSNVCDSDTDQRGIKRPQGSACDIGAYEYKQ
jgi:Zn-dependent protease with chaperone function